MKIVVTVMLLLVISVSVSAQGSDLIETPGEKAENGLGNLNQFGFGPAFFVVSYDDEVLKDSKDVKMRGDGTISASGSDYSTTIGLEVHYSLAILPKCRINGRKVKDRACKNAQETDDVVISGHSVSPFLGLYDLDNGINGIAAGIVYGYWHGDNKLNDRTSLNVGLGWTVHKDRLVLADNVNEGKAPPVGLNAEDYTERKDVEGVTLMVSASVGF